MKKSVFIGFLCLSLILGSFSAFGQVPKNISDLQDGVAAFSKSLAKSLPFNASMGLNWSDAYVGKILPSVPPHFGVGVSLGVTTIEMKPMKKITQFMGFNSLGTSFDNLYFPAYAAEARIGGFFLPFDIGIKYGTMPTVSMPLASVDFDYSMFGVDLRYALMEQSLIKPNISIGLGFSYMTGGLGAKVGTGMSMEMTDPVSGTPYTIGLSAPKIGLVWDTKVFELKAQISKSLLIITPYAGIGASYSWSNAGYEVKTQLTGDITHFDDINAALKAAGQKPIVFDAATGISSKENVTGWGLRAFGGLSLNVVLIKFDFTMMINLLDMSYGGQLGIRFQL